MPRSTPQCHWLPWNSTCEIHVLRYRQSNSQLRSKTNALLPVLVPTRRYWNIAILQYSIYLFSSTSTYYSVPVRYGSTVQASLVYVHVHVDVYSVALACVVGVKFKLTGPGTRVLHVYCNTCTCSTRVRTRVPGYFLYAIFLYFLFLFFFFFFFFFFFLNKILFI